jgi:hypothetical protein
MGKTAMKVKNWPFEKGEKAKLIWIGEPFKQNNKWMFYAYFKVDKITKKVLLDWGSIHFLICEKYYKDGDLNNAEAEENGELVELNLSSVKVEYREKPWNIWLDRHKYDMKSKTFNFIKKGHLYTVPIIEIIRAILAPSNFLLNRILEMDSFENYFTYDISEGKLNLHFTSEYERKLLKEDKINHLAWLLTNEKVLRMFNEIGQNMWQHNEQKFEFLLNSFNIRARIEDKVTYTKICEIVALKKKRINVQEINIYHPSLEESHSSDSAKIRTFINKKTGADKEITSDGDGTRKDSEEIETMLLTHEYENLPKINRRKKGTRVIREKEDENTKKYVIEDDGLRSTADVGGEELIKGLEFTTIDKVEVKGELEEFLEMLRLLKKKPNIKSVNVIIGELNEGIKGKRFARLNDGITKRKYAIGNVVMFSGNQCNLIEVERENKPLSMLVLKSNKLVKWERICSILIIGLVNESGTWHKEDIEQLENEGLVIIRTKHIRKNICDKTNFIYERLK